MRSAAQLKFGEKLSWTWGPLYTPHHGRVPLGDLDAILQQQAAPLVDLGGAPLNTETAHPMERLDILLLDTLERHQAPVRPLHGLANRLGIHCVVLVRFHVRFDELRGHQAHLVTDVAKHPRPMVHAAARVHRHPTGRAIGHERRPFPAGHLRAEHLACVRIHAVRMHAVLGQVEAHRDNWLFATRCHWSGSATSVDEASTTSLMVPTLSS